MPMKYFNGIEIDVPDTWVDRSTVVVGPDDKSINLVVKRRPIPEVGLEQTLEHYVNFMRTRFGALAKLETKAVMVGRSKGVAVRFEAETAGTTFRQTTLLYHGKGEEISATVTQLANDPTPAPVVDKLLSSVRLAGGGRF
jgi:hypothetical protein